MANSLKQDLVGKTVKMRDGNVGTVVYGFGAYANTAGTALFIKLQDEPDGFNMLRCDGMEVAEVLERRTERT
jgi:hypothetical protein